MDTLLRQSLNELFAQSDALRAECRQSDTRRLVTKKYDGLIYKTHEPQPAQQQSTMDEQTAKLWNDGCDARINLALKTFHETLTKAIGHALGHTRADLREQIDVLATSAALRHKLKCLREAQWQSQDRDDDDA